MPSYGKEFERKIFIGKVRLEEGRENKQFDKAIDILVESWNELPEPKYIYNESFLIASWMLDIAIEIHDEKMMREWINPVLESSPERADIGEREEYVGEAYYELGELDKAFDYFSVAAKKSRGGRCFAGRNNKYKKFYLDCKNK